MPVSMKTPKDDSIRVVLQWVPFFKEVFKFAADGATFTNSDERNRWFSTHTMAYAAMHAAPGTDQSINVISALSKQALFALFHFVHKHLTDVVLPPLEQLPDGKLLAALRAASSAFSFAANWFNTITRPLRREIDAPSTESTPMQAYFAILFHEVVIRALYPRIRAALLAGVMMCRAAALPEAIRPAVAAGILASNMEDCEVLAACVEGTLTPGSHVASLSDVASVFRIMAAHSDMLHDITSKSLTYAHHNRPRPAPDASCFVHSFQTLHRERPLGFWSQTFALDIEISADQRARRFFFDQIAVPLQMQTSHFYRATGAACTKAAQLVLDDGAIGTMAATGIVGAAAASVAGDLSFVATCKDVLANEHRLLGDVFASEKYDAHRREVLHVAVWALLGPSLKSLLTTSSPQGFFAGVQRYLANALPNIWPGPSTAAAPGPQVRGPGAGAAGLEILRIIDTPKGEVYTGDADTEAGDAAARRAAAAEAAAHLQSLLELCRPDMFSDQHRMSVERDVSIATASVCESAIRPLSEHAASGAIGPARWVASTACVAEALRLLFTSRDPNLQTVLKNALHTAMSAALDGNLSFPPPARPPPAQQRPSALDVPAVRPRPAGQVTAPAAVTVDGDGPQLRSEPVWDMLAMYINETLTSPGFEQHTADAHQARSARLAHVNVLIRHFDANRDRVVVAYRFRMAERVLVGRDVDMERPYVQVFSNVCPQAVVPITAMLEDIESVFRSNATTVRDRWQAEAGAAALWVPSDPVPPPETLSATVAARKDMVRFYGFRPSPLARGVVNALTADPTTWLAQLPETTVMSLAAQHWPPFTNADIVLPPPLHRAIDAWLKMVRGSAAGGSATGRHLSSEFLQHRLFHLESAVGSVEIDANFPLGPKKLVCPSAVHAAVILAFNSAEALRDGLTVAQLCEAIIPNHSGTTSGPAAAAAAAASDTPVVRDRTCPRPLPVVQLHHLICILSRLLRIPGSPRPAPALLLVERPTGPGTTQRQPLKLVPPLEPTDIVKMNPGFCHPHLKVRLPFGKDQFASASANSREVVSKEVASLRKHQAESVVVRALKQHRTLPFAGIHRLAATGLQKFFQVDVALVKATVNDLIAKDIISRDVEKPDVLHYQDATG
eukprot:TRINITY_DN4630_c0_g1_i1.p1 TRINITY_DN4630_c0_g1~~TRINITY_DN4630_c0_g1_i1.p1  ORF type:complete len:1129 (-),score=157.54 TRINITY_DN4630_c0_g1_i1:126-3512(-)